MAKKNYFVNKNKNLYLGAISRGKISGNYHWHCLPITGWQVYDEVDGTVVTLPGIYVDLNRFIGYGNCDAKDFKKLKISKTYYGWDSRYAVI